MTRRSRGAALLLCLTVATCRPAGVRPLEVGDTAPVYQGVTLGGDTISVGGLRGRPILLNVWATWCVPCQGEMPAIARLDQELGSRGLQVVGVNVDAAGSTADIDRFTREYGLRFPIVLDPAGMCRVPSILDFQDSLLPGPELYSDFHRVPC